MVWQDVEPCSQHSRYGSGGHLPLTHPLHTSVNTPINSFSQDNTPNTTPRTKKRHKIVKNCTAYVIDFCVSTAIDTIIVRFSILYAVQHLVSTKCDPSITDVQGEKGHTNLENGQPIVSSPFSPNKHHQLTTTTTTIYPPTMTHRSGPLSPSSLLKHIPSASSKKIMHG